MNRMFHKSIIIAAVLSISLLRCGSSISDPMAGGTGTGNPGGSTTLAILVESPEVLNKPAAGPADTGKQLFRLIDAGGMPMQVTSAAVMVRLVTFTLDTGENPLQLLQQFNQPLQHDSGNIALPGSRTFDAMTGQCDPVIDTLRLPEARYTGVRLSLDTLSAGGPRNKNSPFTVGGTFDYLGVTRTFAIHLNINAPLQFLLQTGVFAISRSDTTDLSIVFNPQQWLEGVNIKACLDSGLLQLDTEGNLVIDGNTAGGGGPCQSIEGTIRGNVISSGRLVVRQ